MPNTQNMDTNYKDYKEVNIMANNVEKLLKLNSKALQGLHYVKGYDFTKPFDVVSGDGSFTLNKIKKECSALGIDIENTVATLLVKHTIKAFLNRDLYIVDIPSFCKFKIYESHREVGTKYNFKYNFDLYYGVGNFEEHRKKMTETWFVVIQKKEYLVESHKDIYGDYKDRFVIDSFGYGYKTAIQEGKEVNVKNVAGYSGQKVFVVNGTEPKTTDKSGYCMEYYKGELQRRLRAYKANKRKNEADSYILTSDITREVEDIKTKLGTLKHTLAEMLLQDKYNIISSVMYKYCYACDGLKRLEEKLSDKRYNSISEIRFAIENINEYYNEIIEKINNVI